MGSVCSAPGFGDAKRVVLLGLDNAGKTTLLGRLCGVQLVPIPTNGYNEQHLMLQNKDVKILELGGQRALRGTWDQFLGQLAALIWVVDAADQRRIAEVSAELDVVLSKLQAAKGTKKSIPVLVLANKSDLQLAMSETEVAQRLALHTFNMDYAILRVSAFDDSNVVQIKQWLERKLFMRNAEEKAARAQLRETQRLNKSTKKPKAQIDVEMEKALKEKKPPKQPKQPKAKKTKTK